MKKTLVAILSAIILILGGGVAGDQLGSRDIPANTLTTLTHVSTSTVAGLPVKLLDPDLGLKYALITNVSDTTMYLFALTAAEVAAGASTTITDLDSGIPVVANASYEIDADNLYVGYLYASSSAASKAISVQYTDQ